MEGFYGFVVAEMERQGVRRSALAERMGCAPANVTQILKQKANLTVASMVDLAYHLGAKLELDALGPVGDDDSEQGKNVVVQKDAFSSKRQTAKKPARPWNPIKGGNLLTKLGA